MNKQASNQAISSHNFKMILSSLEKRNYFRLLQFSHLNLTISTFSTWRLKYWNIILLLSFSLPQLTLEWRLCCCRCFFPPPFVSKLQKSVSMIVFRELTNAEKDTSLWPEGVDMWLWWIRHIVGCLLGKTLVSLTFNNIPSQVTHLLIKESLVWCSQLLQNGRYTFQMCYTLWCCHIGNYILQVNTCQWVFFWIIKCIQARLLPTFGISS
jgi:hypothetical protein